MTVQEVLEEVMSDQPYYRRSGGGVTLSGGEALVQPDFATALLDACQWQGITTAVETTGFAPFETVERYLPRLDYVLMDIKHMDSDKHKAFTGQPNELILENARKIAQKHPHLTIRTPVVPASTIRPTRLRRSPGLRHRCPASRGCICCRIIGSARVSMKDSAGTTISKGFCRWTMNACRCA